MFSAEKTVKVQVIQVIYFTGLVWFQIAVNGTVASERASEESAWRAAATLATRLKAELQLDMITRRADKAA